MWFYLLFVFFLVFLGGGILNAKNMRCLCAMACKVPRKALLFASQ